MIVIKFICTSAFIRSLKKRSINILIHIKEQNKTKYDKTIRRQTKKKLAVNIIFRTLNEKKQILPLSMRVLKSDALMKKNR